MYLTIVWERDIFAVELKHAKIIVVFNKSKVIGVNNYRPISLLPVFNKLFEHILAIRWTSLLIEYHIISDTQLELVSNMNTGDAIFKRLVHMYRSLSRKYLVAGIYF